MSSILVLRLSTAKSNQHYKKANYVWIALVKWLPKCYVLGIVEQKEWHIVIDVQPMESPIIMPTLNNTNFLTLKLFYIRQFKKNPTFCESWKFNVFVNLAMHCILVFKLYSNGASQVVSHKELITFDDWSNRCLIGSNFWWHQNNFCVIKWITTIHCR